MKEGLQWFLIVFLISINGYFFMTQLELQKKVSHAESILATYEEKALGWDLATEVLEDCMEYNTLGECKRAYPQYAD